MKTTEIIRANFEKAIADKGLTIAKIAQAQGVKRQTIYSYFRPGVALTTIEKMASIAGVQPWELLKPIEPTPQEQPEPTTQTAICPHCGKPIQLCKPEPTQEIEQ